MAGYRSYSLIRFISSELPRYFHPNFWRVLTNAENNQNRDSNKDRLSRTLIPFLDLYNDQNNRINSITPTATTTTNNNTSTPNNNNNNHKNKKKGIISNVVSNLKRIVPLPNPNQPKQQRSERLRINIVLLGIPQAGKRYVRMNSLMESTQSTILLMIYLSF